MISTRGRVGIEIYICVHCVCTVCPRSSDPFHIVSYYIKGSLLFGHIVYLCVSGTANKLSFSHDRSFSKCILGEPEVRAYSLTTLG